MPSLFFCLFMELFMQNSTLIFSNDNCWASSAKWRGNHPDREQWLCGCEMKVQMAMRLILRVAMPVLMLVLLG